jgi:8-oxo-dGTP pyrophosphatase MutT (NUDIX family)
MRDWASKIRECLAGTVPSHLSDGWLLPGLTADQSRAFRDCFPADPIPAAVLIPLIEREGALTVLLTQRATQLKNHAGQISFPGGRIEPGDESAATAALREAWEEIGLEEEYVSVAGFLPDHIVISGFRVTPVVGFVRPGFELLLDSKEVEDVFEVPLEHVFEPANHRSRMRRLGNEGVEVELCDIHYGEHVIWGATAGMLLTLLRMCRQGHGDV